MSERELDNAMLMGKILARLESIDTKLEEFTGEQCKIRDRLTALEAFRYKLMGMASVVGAIASFIFSKFQ